MPGLQEETIVLGPEVIRVSTLKIGQLKKLMPMITGRSRLFTEGRPDAEAILDSSLEIIALATGWTAEKLLDVPATLPEINQAVTVVLELAGLAVSQVGESQPAVVKTAGSETSEMTSATLQEPLPLDAVIQ